MRLPDKAGALAAVGGRRMLLISTEFPPGPGGIGTHAWALARGLIQAGWAVRVVTRQDYASPVEVEAFNRAAPFDIHPQRSARSSLRQALHRWRELRTLCVEWRPNLLLGSGSRAVWTTAALSRTTGIPSVAIAHGSEFGAGARPARILTRWAFEACAAVVCVSEYTAARLKRAGIRTRSCVVIPNGADPETFGGSPLALGEETRTHLGLGSAPFILTLGNVTERKGQETVVRAMPEILGRCADVHYIAAGLPTRAESLKALARQLGVEDRVHFPGRVTMAEAGALLRGCELFVMTSRNTAKGDFEGYGIAVVEAALCGKPAVVSRDSGLAEAILDGKTGIGVAENDPQATAQAVIELLTNPQRRRHMGAAARARALSEQTWAHRMTQYERLLQALLPAPRAALDGR